MAVGNIVGVEPLDNGAYNFVDKGGKKMTLFGPEAEDLAQRFRASDELQRGTKPTAQVTQEDLVQGAGGFGGFGGQVPQPNIATDAPAPVPGLEGPPASIARPPEAEAAPEAPSLAQAGARFTDDKGNVISQQPDGSWVKVKTTAPTRGGMMEKSRSISGGFQQDPDYLAATEQAFRGQAESQAKGAEIAVNEAQVEQAYLAQQQRQNAMRIEQQQAQQKTIEDGIRAKQAEYDLINESYKAQKVDPWRGMGTGQKIGLALFGALGAFGAGMAKSPNFVQAMIDGYIERQIREQEREIAVKREQAQNTLADLEKKLGSRDLAKTALSAMLTERTQLQLQNMTASLKAPKIVAAFQDANAKLTQQYADKLEEYRQKAGGQITKSIVNVPGSAGGTSVTPLSLDEAAKVKNLYKETGPKKDPGAVKEERELAIAAERLNSYEDRLKDYDEDAVPLTKENRWIGGRIRTGVQDWFAGEGTSTRTAGAEEQQLIQDFESVKTDLTGAMAKGAGTGTLSDGDRAAIQQGLAPGASVGIMRRAIAAAREVNQRSAEVIRKFGPVPAQEIPTRPVE